MCVCVCVRVCIVTSSVHLWFGTPPRSVFAFVSDFVMSFTEMLIALNVCVCFRV
jgi:hypothetical protein